MNIIEPIKFIRIDKAGQVWWNVPGVGVMQGTFEEALRERLKNPEQNAEYVAAYLSYHRNTWYKETGIDLSQKPEVWITLYNIHLGEKGYHSNPGANDFGKYGRANMYYAGNIINMS